MSVRAVGGVGDNLYVLPLDGCTQSVPACSPTCPPCVTWPAKSLIVGVCPVCGRFGLDGRRAAQALRARRLLKAL